MLQIALIGSSHKEETLLLSTALHTGRRNQVKIRSSYGGTIRNVAHNLGLMKLAPNFCTKLGNDDDSVQLWNQLNNLGVLMFGPTVDLPTPKKVTILPPDGQPTVFWDRPDDFTFQPDDLLPHAVFAQADLCLTDIKNDLVLSQLTKKSPHTKWILSHHIPDKNILVDIYGLVLNYEDALTLGNPSEFERICYRLCEFGPKFVIINLNFQGIYLYSNHNGMHYPTRYQESGYYNGCYSAFLSGFVAGLACQTSTEIATGLGLDAAALTYKTVDLINPEISELLHH